MKNCLYVFLDLQKAENFDAVNHICHGLNPPILPFWGVKILKKILCVCVGENI